MRAQGKLQAEERLVASDYVESDYVFTSRAAARTTL